MPEALNEKSLPCAALISKNVFIFGRRTSLRLEPQMWSALQDIAKREKCTIHQIVSLVSLKKGSQTSLTAAVRVFLILYYRSATTSEGHAKAGHGNFEHMKEQASVKDWLGGESLEQNECAEKHTGVCKKW